MLAHIVGGKTGEGYTSYNSTSTEWPLTLTSQTGSSGLLSLVPQQRAMLYLVHSGLKPLTLQGVEVCVGGWADGPRETIQGENLSLK